MSRPHRSARSAAVFIILGLLAAAPAWAQSAAWSRAHEFRGVQAGALVHDTARDRMLLLMGSRTSVPTDEVFVSPAGGTPAWRYLATQGTTPPARAFHTAVYDPVRDRVLMIGGSNNGVLAPATLWALTFAPDGHGTWSSLATTGAVPAGDFAELTYDATHDRLLLFPGGSSLVNAQVWQLPLTGAAVWSAIATPDPGPSVTGMGVTGFYDAAADRAVLVGLLDGAAGISTLALGTPGANWATVYSAGPNPSTRPGATMAFDPVRRRVTLFGGFDGTPLDEVWQLSLVGAPAWQKVTSGGPGPAGRTWAQAFHDAVRDRMVLFGGETSGYSGLHQDHEDDTWALGLAGAPAWQQLEAGSPRPPTALWDHSFTLDVNRNRVLSMGGVNALDMSHVLAWSPLGDARWQSLATSGAPPPARRGHTATLDPGRDRILVVGGVGASGALSDVWALQLSTLQWSPVVATGAPTGPLNNHAAVLDAARDRLLIVRGATVNALSLSGTPTWSSLTPGGTAPVTTATQSAILDTRRDRMIVYGGLLPPEEPFGLVWDSERTWALSLSGTPAWTELAGAPAALEQHRAVHDEARDRMLVYGGMHRFDLWEYTWLSTTQLMAYSLAGNSWSFVPTSNTPRRRQLHGLALDPRDGSLLAFGGVSDNADGLDPDYTSTDLWRLTFAGTVDAPPALPPALLGATAFPNPARGPLTLRCSVPRTAATSVRIFDAQGRLVRTLVDATLAPGVHTFAWDTRDDGGAAVAPGLYLGEVRSGESKRVARVVVTR